MKRIVSWRMFTLLLMSMLMVRAQHSRVTGTASDFMQIAENPESETLSYTVWTDSEIYYAKDSNGTLVKSSTNASDVINWAIAMTSKNGGGTVELLKGTYYAEKSVILLGNVHLQGESRNLTKITVADSTSTEGFNIPGARYYTLVIAVDSVPIINAEISDLTIDPNSRGIGFPLAPFDATLTPNYYLKVHDCYFPEGGLWSQAAISLKNSVNAEIYSNIILNQRQFVYVTCTNYTNIHDNFLDTSAWEGIYFDKNCYHNTISGNTVRNASYLRPDEQEALEMHGSCKYNTVKDNTFQFCINSIWDAGQGNIITNNYFKDVYNGIYIRPYVYGVSDDIVTGNHIQNATHVGIGIENASNVIVSSNFLEGDSLSDEGLRAYNSNNVTFHANQVKSVYDGINLFQSMSCTVVGNEITTSVYGIYVGGSDYNTIVSNNITENGCGIELYYSSNNKFYHNNFVNNRYQVTVRGESYNNVWDDGYPSGGNYWGDYTIRYPSAQELDDSGIWAIPYTIDASNRDSYPLMSPYIAGDINYDGTVNASDLSAFGRTFGAMPESPNWNARADMDNNFIVNVVDLFHLGRNYGKSARLSV